MNRLFKSFLTRWLRPTQTPPAWIESEELLVQMASTRAPLVIDVRGPEKFSGPLGHIENAVNTP